MVHEFGKEPPRSALPRYRLDSGSLDKTLLVLSRIPEDEEYGAFGDAQSISRFKTLEFALPTSQAIRRLVVATGAKKVPDRLRQNYTDSSSMTAMSPFPALHHPMFVCGSRPLGVWDVRSRGDVTMWGPRYEHRSRYRLRFGEGKLPRKGGLAEIGMGRRTLS